MSVDQQSERETLTHYPYSALTDIGQNRAINEDSVLAIPPLFVVADGLGGHDAGEIASAIAVETIREYGPRRADTTALARAVQHANTAIMNAIQQGAGPAGMGTTVTAAYIKNGQCAIAQVGDSRAYLFRDGRLSQITHDHSLVGAMLRSGHLSEDEARAHPDRSVITRALGSDANLNVDTYLIPVLNKDRIILCSDGLTAMVHDSHIAEILTSSKTPLQATQNLINAANYAGGADNISVVAIDIDPSNAVRGSKRTKSTLWKWIFLWVTLCALIVGGITYGAKRYIDSKAFLGLNKAGMVCVYQGIPGHILGYEPAKLSAETTVAYDSLDAVEQTEIEDGTLYDGVEAAKLALDEMVQSQ